MDYHTTRDGHNMPICSMTNDHLEKTMKLFCRHVEQAVNALESTNIVEGIMAIIHDIDDEAIKYQAKEAVKNYYKRLQPYVMEGVMRGMDVSFVAKAFGREGKEEVLGISLDGFDDLQENF